MFDAQGASHLAGYQERSRQGHPTAEQAEAQAVSLSSERRTAWREPSAVEPAGVLSARSFVYHGADVEPGMCDVSQADRLGGVGVPVLGGVV